METIGSPSEVGFTRAWSNFTEAIGLTFESKLGMILSIIGIAILVFSIISYFWQRRRGGVLGNLHSQTVPLIISACLVAPTIIVPILLFLAEVIVMVFNNAFVWVTSQ